MPSILRPPTGPRTRGEQRASTFIRYMRRGAPPPPTGPPPISPRPVEASVTIWARPLDTSNQFLDTSKCEEGLQVDQWHEIDQYGELLFGRRIRLRVLLWVFRQGTQTFNQTEAARGIDYSANSEVGKELERLVKLGMVRKFGRPGKVGPQIYVRVEHPWWAIVDAANKAASGVDRITRTSPSRAHMTSADTA